MKVLVVSVVHTPLDARIHHRQIRALRAAGIEVTQVAPWSATAPTAHEGASDVTRVDVERVDVPRAVGRHRLRALRHARRVIGRLGADHDLVLLHDPELVLAVLGRLRRLPPVVLDVHEDQAASVRDRDWLPPALRAVAIAGVRRLERWAEEHLASLILAEAGYQARFRRPHPLVPNLPWLPTDPEDDWDPRRVVYVGRISTGRGARELVEIARRLRLRDGPHLELIGPADVDVETLLRDAHDRGQLTWHGFLPNDEAMRRVRGALAGLAPLHDLPNYRVSMPTKVVEYLANGVPAIVTPLPEAARLIEASGSGVVVPFGDVSETVDAILALASDPQRRRRWGAAGRDHIASAHSWDAAAPAFVDHLRNVARRVP